MLQFYIRLKIIIFNVSYLYACIKFYIYFLVSENPPIEAG